MLEERITIERRKAILLTVELNGTTEEYAMAWLKLTNNAREYSNRIWKISNTNSNVVYVLCNPKSVESVKDFCNEIYITLTKDNELNFVGKVIDEKEIIVGVPIYEWNSNYSIINENKEWEKDFNKSIHNWLEVEYI